MITGPLPDLASALRLQRDAGAVRAALERSGQELTSGRKQDLFAASGGDPAHLFAIETSQTRAEREAQSIALSQGRIAVTQSVMGGLQDLADTLGPEMTASLERGDLVSARLQAAGATAAFRNAVHALNSRHGDRSLFAGAGVDGPALDTPGSILADVKALVDGAADATDAINQVNAYFADPVGGFSARYLGATEDAPEAGIDEGDSVDISRRADDPEVVTLLKGLAMAAIAVDPNYAGPPDAVEPLLNKAASLMLDARQSIVNSRAELGISERILEEASVRVSARRETLDLAWNAIVSRDPYEAATEFQAIEQQLERLFAVTARLSTLNLTDFLR